MCAKTKFCWWLNNFLIRMVPQKYVWEIKIDFYNLYFNLHDLYPLTDSDYLEFLSSENVLNFFVMWAQTLLKYRNIVTT